MYSIKDLLEKFDDFKLLTAENMNPEIVSVSVMDAPDIERWMKGGEFLITSGYILVHREEDFKELVVDLKQRSIAALGIKVSRFMHHIPDEIIKLANSIDFCIIEIPEHYAFTDIISPILADIVNQRYRDLTLSEEISQKFLKIGVADVSYEKILNLLAHYVGNDIYFYNSFTQTIHRPHKNKKDINLQILESHLYTSYEVDYQRIHYGKLFVRNTSQTFQYRIAITHAITMFRLSIQTILSSKRYEEQRRNDFLSDLILNNIKTKEEIDFRSQEYGWHLNDGIFCAVFQLEPRSTISRNELIQKRYHQLELLRAYLKKSCKNCYYVTFTNYLVFLVVGLQTSDYPKDFKEMISDCIHHFMNLEFAMTIGIGSVYLNITDSYKSFSEAKIAASLGKKIFGSSNHYYFSDVSTYSLFQYMDENDFNCMPYFKDVVNINKRDQDNGEMFATLGALIDADWIMVDACKYLNVHYNTIKYRVSKLKEMTGWKLQGREEKFQIELAYKLVLIQEKQKVQNDMHLLSLRNI